MKVMHFIGRSRLASLVLAGGLLSVVSTAWADVRPAVRKVLPATVAVKWQAKPDDDKSGAASKKTSRTPHIVGYGIAGGKRTVSSTWPIQYDIAVWDGEPSDVSLASGTVVSADGLIVVATAFDNRNRGSISVTFNDGKTLPARIVVKDERSHLQLLKVDAKNLPFVKVAEVDVELGQDVIATPCTDLKDRIVTRGIITAKNRSVVGPVPDALQTDLLIGEMGSGAPLVNAQGVLVGILVAGSGHDHYAASNKSRQGIAFARPAFWVRALLGAYKADATVTVSRGLIGISFASDDSAVAKSVVSGSAAEKAGITPGDKIVQIETHPIASAQDVIRIIGRGKVGDGILVTVLREGKKHEKKLKIGTIQVRQTSVSTQPTKAKATYKVQSVTPSRVIVLSKDGKTMEVEIEGTLSGKPKTGDIGSFTTEIQKQIEAARKQYEAARKLPTRTSTIRVQRSDVEKKIDTLGKQVESLTDRIDKLTDQLEKLAKQLEKKDANE